MVWGSESLQGKLQVIQAPTCQEVPAVVHWRKRVCDPNNCRCVLPVLWALLQVVCNLEEYSCLTFTTHASGILCFSENTVSRSRTSALTTRIRIKVPTAGSANSTFLSYLNNGASPLHACPSPHHPSLQSDLHQPDDLLVASPNPVLSCVTSPVLCSNADELCGMFWESLLHWGTSTPERDLLLVLVL